MSFYHSDPMGKIFLPEKSDIHQEPVDQFDRLPDSLLLTVFNKIGDVKALGSCCTVSRRFHDLVSQVENVTVKVDCVISDSDKSVTNSGFEKGRNAISHLLRLIFGVIGKPIQVLSHILGPRKYISSSTSSTGTFSHHSPTEVLKNFNNIRKLRIELPGGELGIDDEVLLKWKADFGSTLDSCVILGASSLFYDKSSGLHECNNEGFYNDDSRGNIPDSFYTNGGLKSRVVWTISSLIAASARHYLLKQIISEHKTLESLVLSDSDGQGVLCMDKDQLDELRMKPLSASTSANRTVVPALNMNLWYAPQLELQNGMVLKGATLVAIRPSDQIMEKKEISDACWVSKAFEEPYGSAAELLVKRRTYCLEMNSF